MSEVTQITKLNDTADNITNVVIANGPGNGIGAMQVTLEDAASIATFGRRYIEVVDFQNAVDFADLTAKAQEYLDSKKNGSTDFEVVIYGSERNYEIGDLVRVADTRSGQARVVEIMEVEESGDSITLWLGRQRPNLFDSIIDEVEAEEKKRKRRELPIPNVNFTPVSEGIDVKISAFTPGSRAVASEIHASRSAAFEATSETLQVSTSETRLTLPIKAEPSTGNGWFVKARSIDAFGDFSEFSDEYYVVPLVPPQGIDEAAAQQIVADAIADGDALAQSLEQAQYPVIRSVSALPQLPNTEYPSGSMVFLTTDNKLYRNDGGIWKAAVDPDGVIGAIGEGTIQKFQLMSSLRTIDVVDPLPALPSPDYVEGDMVIYLGKTYILQNGAWADRMDTSFLVGQIPGPQIEPGTIDRLRFASEILPPETVNSIPPANDADFSNDSIVIYNGVMYIKQNGTWSNKVQTSRLDGEIPGAQITPGTIDRLRMASDLRVPVSVSSVPPVPDDFPNNSMVNFDGMTFIKKNGVWSNKFSTSRLDGQIQSLQIAEGAIGKAQIETALRVPEFVSSLPALSNADYPEGSMVYLSSEKKLYRRTATAWDKSTEPADITAGTLAAGVIVSSNIQANQILLGGGQNLTHWSSDADATFIDGGQIYANSITTKQLNVGSFENLIQNPKFDDGLAPHFIVSGGGSWYIETGAGETTANRLIYNITGQTSQARLEFNGNRSGPKNVHASARPGEKYALTVQMRRSASSNRSVVLRALFYREDGSYISSGGEQTKVLSGTIQEYFYESSPAPIESSFVVFEVLIQPGQNGGFIHIENVYARPYLTGQMIVDGTITANKLQVNELSALSGSLGAITAGTLGDDSNYSGSGVHIGADVRIDASLSAEQIVVASGYTLDNWSSEADATLIEGGRIAAKSITTKQLAVGSFENLIQNAKFDDGLAPHFLVSGGGVWALGTGTGETTANRLVYNITGQTSQARLEFNGFRDGPKSVHASARPGEKYALTVQMRRSASSNRSVVLRALFYREDGSFISSGGEQTKVLSGTMQEYFYESSPAPIESSFVVFEVLIQPGQNGGFIHIENAYARPYLTGQMIVDGTISANKLLVNELSALSGNLGAITAGNLDSNQVHIGADVRIDAALSASQIVVASGYTLDNWSSSADATLIEGGRIAAKSIKTLQLGVGEFENYIENPKFDDGIAPHVVINAGGGVFYIEPGTSTPNRLTYNATNQTSNALLDLNGLVENKTLQPSARPGEIYVLEFSVKVTGTVSKTVGVQTFFYRDDGSYVGSGGYIARTIPPGTAFTRLSFKSNPAPNGADHVGYRITIPSGQGGFFLFENLIGRRAMTGSMIVDGSIKAEQLNVNELSALSGSLGAITAGTLGDSTGYSGSGVHIGADVRIDASLSVDQILVADNYTLANWSSGADATLIDGGVIATNTIHVDSLNAGSITANNANVGLLSSAILVSDAIQTNMLAAKSITSDKMLVGFGNLLENPSFLEEGNTFSEAAGWDDTNFSRTDEQFRRFGQSMRKVSAAGTSGYLRSKTRHAVSKIGEIFRVSYWYKTIGASVNATLRLRLVRYNSQGQILGEAFGEAFAQTNSNDWLERSAQIAVTDHNCAFVSFDIEVSNHTSGHLYIDDTRLDRAEDGELIVDGAITANKISAIDASISKITAGNGGIEIGNIGGKTWGTGTLPSGTEGIWGKAGSGIYIENTPRSLGVLKESVTINLNNISAGSSRGVGAVFGGDLLSGGTLELIDNETLEYITTITAQSASATSGNSYANSTFLPRILLFGNVDGNDMFLDDLVGPAAITNIRAFISTNVYAIETLNNFQLNLTYKILVLGLG